MIRKSFAYSRFLNRGQAFYISAFAALAAGVVGCQRHEASQIKNRNATDSSLSSTTFKIEDQQIRVLLTNEDSARLEKALPRVVILPVPAPDDEQKVRKFGQDLTVDCKKSGQSSGLNCSISIQLEPTSSENFVLSDSDRNEYMFHLRQADEAERLYKALDVKEWDLQGSTYKRFSSSDNKMILECILDNEKSRCSIFLGDGKSDDYSD